MVRIVGILLSVVFAVLGLLHLYWAAGGSGGGQSAIPMFNGERLFTPSPGSTLAVAALLFLAMLIVLGRIGVWGANLPAWPFYVGTFGISLAFLVRAVGDFRYVGFFKTVSDTDFARLDNYLFSPLCLLIAIAALIIGVSRKTN